MKDLKHIKRFKETKDINKINESLDEMEKEIINGQIDFAISVLSSMFEKIKGNDISTEEFNEILDSKIKKLASEKYDIDEVESTEEIKTLDSVYDFDKTYLEVEKESVDKVRLTIKSGYRGGEELDIVVNLNKLKSSL